MKMRLAVVAFLFGVASAPQWANAQVSPSSIYNEHNKLVRASDTVGVLGADLFGDQVDLYTGSLEFIQTDVTLPGNSALPVSIGRRLATGAEQTSVRVQAAFADWDLEIPHVYGVFARSTGFTGQYGAAGRCSRFGVPPNIPARRGGPFLDLQGLLARQHAVCARRRFPRNSHRWQQR